VNISEVTWVSIKAKAVAIHSEGFSAGTQINESISFRVTSVTEQGLYWCRVKDASGRIFDSQKASIILSDVSSTKLSLRIDQPFTISLLNTKSKDYLLLKTQVTQIIQLAFSRKGISDSSQIYLQNIRKGSVLVDALVYFSGANITTKTYICNKANNLQNSDFSSLNLNIISFTITNYDCCLSELTGDTQIKGTINWPDTAPGTSIDVKCPYVNQHATIANARRICKGMGFTHVPKWQEPDTSQCAFKTKTTKQLSELSQISINSSNVVDAATKLDNLTSNPALVTNNLDVKLAVNIMEKIIRSNHSLNQVANSLVNVTSNLMDTETEIIVDAQSKYETSKKLLLAVQKLADEIPLNNGTKVYTAVRKNIGISISIINMRSSTTGVAVEGFRTSLFGYNNVTLKNANKQVVPDTAIVHFFLPPSLFKRVPSNISRISAFIYDNVKLFLTSKNLSNSALVNSKVMSTSVKGVKFVDLPPEDELRSAFYPTNPTLIGSPKCVFWNFTLSDWSKMGCRYAGEIAGFTRCRCNHFTNFAVLLSVGSVPLTKEKHLAINIITYIGCGISLAALFITLLTFLLFRKTLLTRSPPKVHLCLSISMSCILVALIIGMNAKHKAICQAASLFIHYSVISSFLWMGAEAYNLYLHFVKIFNAHRDHLLRNMMLICWGIPVLIVGITAGATKLENYTSRAGSELICMINGIPFYVTYLAPILVIITANFIVMILTFRKVFEKSAATKKNQLDASKRLRIIVSCSVLMGVTWILGVFAIGELTFTFQLLFTIFNSLQGLFIFIFYCAMNKEAVVEWKRVFGIAASESSSSTGKTSKASARRRKITSTDTTASKAAKESCASEVSIRVDSQSIVEEQNKGAGGGVSKRFPVCGFKTEDADGIELIHVKIEQGESTS